MIVCFGSTNEIARGLSLAAERAGFATWRSTKISQLRGALNSSSGVQALFILADVDRLLLADIMEEKLAIPVVGWLLPGSNRTSASAQRMGVTAVLPLPIEATLVRRVLDAIQEGSIPRGPAGALAVPRRPLPELTPREQQVLNLICGGSTNKVMGRTLGISPRTVEAYRGRIMAKFGARNAVDLVRIVFSTKQGES